MVKVYRLTAQAALRDTPQDTPLYCSQHTALVRSVRITKLN